MVPVVLKLKFLSSFYQLETLTCNNLTVDSWGECIQVNSVCIYQHYGDKLTDYVYNVVN